MGAQPFLFIQQVMDMYAPARTERSRQKLTAKELSITGGKQLAVMPNTVNRTGKRFGFPNHPARFAGHPLESNMAIVVFNPNMDMEAMLGTAKVGDFVKFKEERQKYEIQASGARFIVCTKPFNAKKTTLYTVVDLEERVRGTENLIFGAGAETRGQCEEMLMRLEGRCVDTGFQTEVSHRNRIPLKISSVFKHS